MTAIPEDVELARLLFKGIREAEELLDLPPGSAFLNATEWELAIPPFGLVLSADYNYINYITRNGIRAQVWNRDNVVLPSVVAKRLPWIGDSKATLQCLYDAIHVIRQLQVLLGPDYVPHPRES